MALLDISNHYHKTKTVHLLKTRFSLKYKHYERIHEIKQSTFNQSRNNLDNIVSLVRDWNKVVKHSDNTKNQWNKF